MGSFFYLVFFLCVHPLVSLMVMVFFTFYYFAHSRICLHEWHKIQLWQIWTFSYIWKIKLLLIQYECTAIWLFKYVLIAVYLYTLKIIKNCFIYYCLYYKILYYLKKILIGYIISHIGNGRSGKETVSHANTIIQ